MNPFHERKTIWFWQDREGWEVESGWIRLKLHRTIEVPESLLSYLKETRAKWGIA